MPDTENEIQNRIDALQAEAKDLDDEITYLMSVRGQYTKARDHRIGVRLAELDRLRDSMRPDYRMLRELKQAEEVTQDIVPLYMCEVGSRSPSSQRLTGMRFRNFVRRLGAIPAAFRSAKTEKGATTTETEDR
jgi:hypothetical protein